MERVSKGFGKDTTGVAEVSLELGPGEILAVLGASGSGKTTLLNLVAGVLRPDRGKIFLGQADIAQWMPEQRRLAYVFQDHALWPHLSVLDHLLLVMKQANRKEALGLLEQVGLGSLENRRPHQLSGGQRQRVALARALAAQPRLILLDEPYSALDPVLREGLRLEVASLLRARGVSALHVTHDPDEALAVASRVAVMSQGRVVQIDDPARVYAQPATLAAAQAFGRLNLLPVKVSGGRVAWGSGFIPVQGIREGLGLMAFRYENLQPQAGGEPGRVVEVYAGRGEQLCQVALKLGNVVVALEATLGSTVELAPSGLLSVFSQENPLDKS